MDPLRAQNTADVDLCRQATDRARQDLQGAAGRNDLAGLKQAAQQFEALFMNELLKTMRATVPENSLWGESGGTRIYQQMHDQALSDHLADAGIGFGIADLLVRQFEKTVATQAPTAAPLPSPAPRRLAMYEAAAAPPPTVDRPAAAPRTPSSAAVPGWQQRAAAMGGAVADSAASYAPQIEAAARATGVDPGLLLAVAVQESGGDPRAVSARGARGLMQLMPVTSQEVGITDPHDPGQGLLGGARYLARMLGRYDGRLDLALAAYNAGPGAVDRAGGQVPAYAETRHYVASVQQLAARLGDDRGTDLAR